MNLSEGIERFITTRRESGLGYRQQAISLTRFIRSLGDVQLEQIKTDDVIGFLNQTIFRPYTWQAHYNALRRLFEYWTLHEEIPSFVMPWKKSSVRSDFLPYIYSDDEVLRLLNGVDRSQERKTCGIDAATFRMILFLLFTTGATIGEVLRLTRHDINMKKRTITLHAARTRRLRCIPVSKELCVAIRTFFDRRFSSRTEVGPLFVLKSGRTIPLHMLQKRFRQLRRRCDVRRQDGVAAWPRLSDLRASFAVHRISEWLKSGANLNQMLPALGTYLGIFHMKSIDSFLKLTTERFTPQLTSLSPRHSRKHWRDDSSLMCFLANL